MLGQLGINLLNTEGTRKRTRAEASRENGRKGGRPRANLYLSDFAALGAPPRDVLQLFRWFAACALVELDRAKKGRTHSVFTGEVRATVAATRALHSPVTRAAALELVEADGIEASDPPPVADGQELIAAVWVVRQLADHLAAVVTTESTRDLKRLATVGATVRQLARAWSQADPPDVAVEAARQLRERRKASVGGRIPTVAVSGRQPLRAQ